MTDRNRGIDLNFVLITCVLVVVVIYGSLYPFDFRRSPDSDDLLRSLIHTWRGPFGRGDFLANVLLYLPLGMFSVEVLRRLPLLPRIALVTTSGLALSVGLELLQFYDEGRVSALADVYANTIGVAVGAAAGAFLLSRKSPWQAGTMERRPFILLLLSCWLGYRLFPFVPVIDLHKYWTALKPLVFSPALLPWDLYRHTVIWLAVALLIEAVIGTVRSRVALPALVVTVLFARILIVDAELSPTEVVGGAIAVLMWNAFLSRSRARAAIIAVLFAGAVAMDALRPFQFSAVVRPFGWIPFGGFLHGSIELNIRSFLEKAFTYGALTWLIVHAGRSMKFAVVLGGGFVLCLRLSQVFLPDRSAEITDPIILLILAGVMKAVGEDAGRAQGAPTDGPRPFACADQRPL